jgi:hypothetical protein
VLTLEDAVKTSGHEEKIRVMDISELLAMAIGWEQDKHQIPCLPAGRQAPNNK